MRVISGKYKGKKLNGFNINGTRPTMDRVKESLFAMIQNDLKDSVCLDLFAGSGALGIEALSNGAKKCYFVDHNRKVISILKENLDKIENGIILAMDYKEALSYMKDANINFDLIFLDPPYHEALLSSTIDLIEKYQLLKKDGILVCEFMEEEFTCPYSLLKEKKYHDKTVHIYQKN